MNNKLTIHLIQWRIRPGDVEGNLNRAEELIASASPGRGDLVLLPEMFSSGFYYTDLVKMAEKYEAVVRWMGVIAARYKAGVAGSVGYNSPEGVTNTMVLVDKSGKVVASYDKAHLFHAGDEDQHFTPGQKIVVAQWEGLDVGLAICFDLRFPEMTRKLCDDGARIVLVSAQWPRARVDHFRDLTRVRAMENQLYVVSCNSCGDDDKGLVLGGCSTVVGPGGEVKGVLGDDEGVLTVTIDLDEVEKTRKSFPVLKVRRKDLFGG
ncbi:MAG: carbon-nitrogen family hydrolase [bacterium]|nr:carbon-nitrogen family hydrolase [bacterium]MDT8366290.1 carbon-nitrogen family hydrolase [bacterium]